jgi:hypothetical protein
MGAGTFLPLGIAIGGAGLEVREKALTFPLLLSKANDRTTAPVFGHAHAQEIRGAPVGMLAVTARERRAGDAKQTTPGREGEGLPGIGEGARLRGHAAFLS